MMVLVCFLNILAMHHNHEVWVQHIQDANYKISDVFSHFQNI